MKSKPSSNLVVRGGGLEPPHHFWRQDLNLVRLPISPSSQYPQTAKLRLHSKDRNSTMPRVLELVLGLVEQSYCMNSDALSPAQVA